MDRRKFLKILGFLPVGLLAPKVANTNPSYTVPNVVENVIPYKHTEFSIGYEVKHKMIDKDSSIRLAKVLGKNFSSMLDEELRKSFYNAS